MSPERLAGGAPSPEADVFSLGCVLWSMLAGSAPWAGVAAPQVVRLVGIEGLSLPVPPPPDGCAGCAELEAVLGACLERDPGRRPSAGEAARRLREIARSL
jgi:eukaryotic-like serine/threonine-protein kinase